MSEATQTDPSRTGTDAPSAEDDPIVAHMATEGASVLYRLNVDFEDAVLMIGRVLGGRPEATAAAVTAIDGLGVDATITDPDGVHTARFEFSQRVTDPMKLTDELFALVVAASEQSGDAEKTSAEKEMEKVRQLKTYVTGVVAVSPVNPAVVQVTLGGGDLVDFTPNGPDCFAYLLLPPPGRDDLTVDQSFSWETVNDMPAEDQPVGGYYTVRRWRPESHEIDLLMVLHGDAGPASAWAGKVKPGDPLAIWGPRTAYEPPEGTDVYVLVADDTGLPAVAGILEVLPHDLTVLVFAEVDREETRQELPEHPGARITWLHRDGAEPGTTTLLADAVRAATIPEGTVYVWGGAESRAMTQVRRHVRDDLGLEREAVSLVAYWRHSAHKDDPVD